MPDVVVVGELCADVIVSLDGDPVFGQAETLVRSTRVTMGSSSAITACGIARLGLPTALVGVVGDDLLGGFLVDELSGRGVDVSTVRVDPSVPTGSSTILTRRDGDRAILTHLGSIGRTLVDDVPAGLLQGARHVHVGSYFLQYGLHDHLAAAFEEARSAGRTTSLDPNFDPAQTWDSGIHDVLGRTDVFFCNEEEACAVARVPDVDEALARLLRLMPDDAQVVCKRGAEGAGVHGAAGSERVRAPFDPRPLVDTVGAGDSLAAGYLVARLRGLDPSAALRLGVRAGTASTRAAGGIDAQATWEELTDRSDRPALDD